MKKSSQGFTLIELMIVVAIVGILAVLAVYGVRRYLQSAKTAEAKNSLGQIAKLESIAYAKESMAGTVLATGGTAGPSHNLCASATAKVPATYTAGQKYQSSAADWAGATDLQNNAGWPCLKFTMDEPQYYQYGYTATASAYTATANADLDNNTTFSTFIMTGTVNAAGVLNNAPNLQITNEDE